MSLTSPTFLVVILNWNGRPYLEECLAGVYAQDRPADHFLLVDNGSTDDSVAFLRERFPGLAIHETGGNLGFAAGNNTVLRETNADIILLLNPDVVLSPDCLSSLAEAMAADPAIGIAGCKLWYPGAELIQHAGGFITHPQAMPGHFGIGERDEGAHDTPRDVDYVIGAAMAIRREALEQIGLLDEGFFLYFEDADLCARARRTGFRVTYLPQATAVHIESATAVKGSFAYLHRFHAGRWRYLLKHFQVEEIINRTLLAESAWLEQLAESERRALSLAYLATLRQLPDVWAARKREGLGVITAGEQRALGQVLGDLRARAWRPDRHSEPLARLAAAAQLEERPFTSDVPLLGPLIVRFRNAWNDVASRWYVNYFMKQQNEFNRLAVRQLESYEAELREQMQLLEEQVVITAEMGRRVQELQALLTELGREQARIRAE